MLALSFIRPFNYVPETDALAWIHLSAWNLVYFGERCEGPRRPAQPMCGRCLAPSPPRQPEPGDGNQRPGGRTGAPLRPGGRASATRGPAAARPSAGSSHRGRASCARSGPRSWCSPPGAAAAAVPMARRRRPEGRSGASRPAQRPRTGGASPPHPRSARGSACLGATHL